MRPVDSISWLAWRRPKRTGRWGRDWPPRTARRPVAGTTTAALLPHVDRQSRIRSPATVAVSVTDRWTAHDVIALDDNRCGVFSPAPPGITGSCVGLYDPRRASWTRDAPTGRVDWLFSRIVRWQASSEKNTTVCYKPGPEGIRRRMMTSPHHHALSPASEQRVLLASAPCRSRPHCSGLVSFQRRSFLTASYTEAAPPICWTERSHLAWVSALPERS